MYVFMLV